MTLEYIKCNVDKLTNLDISIKTRKREYVYARWIYFVMARKHTNFGLNAIAKLVNTDHASVLYGMRKFYTELNQSDYLKTNYNTINKILKLEPNYDGITSINMLKIRHSETFEKTNTAHLKEIEELNTIIKELKHNHSVLGLSNSGTSDAINPIIVELLKQDVQIINEIAEYKIKPALQMNKSRVTNEDLINKQKLTRTM